MPDEFEGMPWYERLKLARELEGRYLTPEQIRENGIRNLEVAASMTPLGVPMAMRDAWNASGRGGDALMRGEFGEAGRHYLDMGAAALGLAPGALAASRAAGAAAREAPSRLNSWSGGILNNVEEWKDGFGDTHHRLNIGSRPSSIDKQKITIDPDGSIVMEYPKIRQGGLPGYLYDPGPRLFRYMQDFWHPYDDDIFVRSSLRPDDYKYLSSGTHRGSKNHVTGEMEGGLSVGREPEAYGYNNAYFVRGKMIGRGSDNEPLLDLSTARPAGDLMDYSEMSRKYDTDSAIFLKKNYGMSDDDIRLLKSGYFLHPKLKFPERLP